MNKDEKQEKSFPEPFDQFNESMAPTIDLLRATEQQLAIAKEQNARLVEEIRNKGTHHPEYANLSETIRQYQSDIRGFEAQIPELKSKTYGVFERYAQMHDFDPELTNQAMQVLDEKIYPEKYANKSPEQEKDASQESIEINNEEIKPEISNDVSENRESVENVNSSNVSPQRNNYTLSLFQRKKEEQAKLQSSIGEKTADIDKNVMQNSYQLNYQLKYQKSTIQEQPKEKLVKDFSKNKDDIIPDRD